MEKKSPEYSLGDLRKKSKAELLDLLNRQKNLLSNVLFIDKLPDKGLKIKELKHHIEQALAQLNEVNSMANLFQRLQFNQHQAKNLDSDDDDDPEQDAGIYKTLATNTILEKQYKHENLKHAPNTTSKVFTDTRMSSGIEADHRVAEPTPLGRDRFTAKLTQKLDVVDGSPKSERFRENRTLHKTKSEISTCKNNQGTKNWCDTAVTPPASKFNEAKLISLQESYDLIAEQTQKAKELAIKQAAEQLARSIPLGKMHENTTLEHYTEYREIHSEDQSEDED